MKCNENDRREKKKLHDEQGGALESSRKTIPASCFHRREGRRVYRATLLYRQKKRRREGMVAVHTDGVRNTTSAQCVPETIAGKIV